MQRVLSKNKFKDGEGFDLSVSINSVEVLDLSA